MSTSHLQQCYRPHSLYYYKHNIYYIHIYCINKHRIVTEQSEIHKKKAPEDISKVLFEKFNFCDINQLGFEIPHCRRWYIGPGHVSPALCPSSWFQFGFFLLFIYEFLFFPAAAVSRLPVSAVAATPNDLYPLIGKARQREIIIITFLPKIPQIHAAYIDI